MAPSAFRPLKLLVWVILATLSGTLLMVVVTPSSATSQAEPPVLRFPTFTPFNETDIQSSAVPPPFCAAKGNDRQPAFELPFMSNLTCVNGVAGEFPCNNVDLLSLMPLSQLGGGQANDIWGWTDPETGREYALLGRTNGTAFVDITIPTQPVYVGNLPTHTFDTTWRGVKVYNNHAFIVADYAGEHGMQIFDLTQLRDVTTPPVTFTETTHYNRFGSAHNIVINEQTGYAYATGISDLLTNRTTCGRELHMIDIRNPLEPTFAGCYDGPVDNYTHDAQCVVYNGPDTEYQGREICFNSNVDALTIVDVQDKSNPDELSSVTYDGQEYTHQTWLTDDQQYLLMDDESDERNGGDNTVTYIWNVRDLDAPVMMSPYTSTTSAIDHNQYIRDGYAFQANFQSGLRILDIDDIASADLTEVGYFDFYPQGDAAQFDGAWGVYPFFDSGSIIVSGMEQGLLVFRANLSGLPTPEPTPSITLTPTTTPTATATSTATPTPTGTPEGAPDRLLYLPLIQRP